MGRGLGNRGGRKDHTSGAARLPKLGASDARGAVPPSDQVLQPVPPSPTIARLRLRALLPAGLRARLDLHRRAVLHFVEDTAASLPKGARVLDAGAGEGPYRGLFGHVRYVALDDRRGD